MARLLPQSDEKRLVVDIGGRSTELDTGQRFRPEAVASFRGQCGLVQPLLSTGAVHNRPLPPREIAAKAVLDEALSTYRPDTWDVAYGSSGTIGAVGDMLTAAGFQLPRRADARGTGLAARTPAARPKR